MQTTTAREVFYPRIIVWQLNDSQTTDTLSTHETFLTIDGIARTAKPIVVLTGEHLLHQSDLFEIVEYGFALGLKMIIEAQPLELTPAVLQKYKIFGPKLFRVLINECISEDSETRYRKTKDFFELESAVKRLRDGGFELHLVAPVTDMDTRKLEFYHDYAFRNKANGLYCHLLLNGNSYTNNVLDETSSNDEYIVGIARMKSVSPKDMYVSPQCVKYGFTHIQDDRNHRLDFHEDNANGEWKHWCLGGKTYAFISPSGKVQLCGGLDLLCGNLRTNNYDFKQIWLTSQQFRCVRAGDHSCNEMHSYIKESSCLTESAEIT